jgi:eukaryotic translation initiation factor 2C
MIRYAAQPPNANAHAIETQGLHELGFTQNVPTLNAFGVGISQAMATVPGRVVPPPKIKYKGERELDGRSFRSDKASWNLKEVKFVRGATLTNWAVLLVGDGSRAEFNGPSDPELRNALKAFVEVCGKSGLNITSVPTIADAPLPPYDRTDPGRGKAISNIRAMLPKMIKQKPQLIFIVLPNTDKHIYSGLKRLFDVTLDLREFSLGKSYIPYELNQS